MRGSARARDSWRTLVVPALFGRTYVLYVLDEQPSQRHDPKTREGIPVARLLAAKAHARLHLFSYRGTRFLPEVLVVAATGAAVKRLPRGVAPRAGKQGTARDAIPGVNTSPAAADGCLEPDLAGASQNRVCGANPARACLRENCGGQKGCSRLPRRIQ